ncbi:AAA family ATPase [Nocardia sp. NPDC004568]|uniref:AAA family ATPase n=1 Tax=Nocardia sp. NPDC004568 TaxID=3154551 RepID=UPI0033A77DD8
MTDEFTVSAPGEDEDRNRTTAARKLPEPTAHCAGHQHHVRECPECYVAAEVQQIRMRKAREREQARVGFRSVRLSTFADESDDVPVWAWNHGGKGRIAVGTLALFAGRPGAGKSTGGRYMAAQVSNGTLEGHWFGRPVNVAYIAAEESARYVVKPGLRAAGADLRRVFMPRVELDGEEVRFLSSHDMADLTRELNDHDVRLVVVDPLMSTIGSRTDINRNNEVRSLIEPWAKLAEDIDGVVLGIAHLNKSGNGDVVAGINGSSAFGEVARAVFGFAKDPESETGDRIMSQEKNSIGEEDLALTYRIESTTVTTDSGRTAEVGRFVIVGDSDKTVGDVLRFQPKATTEGAGNTEIDSWLIELLKNGPVLAKDVYTAADGVGHSTDKAKRAKSRINKARGEEFIEAYQPEIPGPWMWRRKDVPETPQGASERPESPDTEKAAPWLPGAPWEVSGGAEDGENSPGSQGAREQGSTRETNVTPLDAARASDRQHQKPRRRITRGGRPRDRRRTDDAS